MKDVSLKTTHGTGRIVEAAVAAARQIDAWLIV